MESEKKLQSNKKSVKKRIKEFCSNSHESVIFLKGDWGIGKTHLVDEIQKEAQNKEDFLIVSLFGLNSIDEVKNRIASPYKRENTLKSIFSDLTRGMAEKATTGGMVANLSVTLFDYICENRLTEKVIIFDDFERKSDKLSTLSILGLIDFLRTKKNKVIILSNEDKIMKDEGHTKGVINNDSWQILKEKVIDCEVQLRIDHEDCLEILMKGIPKNDLEYIVMKNLLIDTNLVNIRIAKLIKNRLREMFGIFKEKINTENKQILTNILINSAKMFYIYYIKENYNEYLEKFNIFLYQEMEEQLMFNSIKSNEKDEIFIFLDNLSINNSPGGQDFFNIVYESIKWGFWELSNLKQSLDKVLEKLELIKNQEELYNFYDNSKFGIVNDFEEKIDDFLTKKIYHPGTICMIYEILKKLNHPKKSLYKDKIENLNLSKPFSSNFYKENPEFISPLHRQHIEIKNNILLSLNSMVVNHIGQDYVINKLNTISELELKELFKIELKKNNLMMIFEQLNRIKDEAKYGDFIKTVKSVLGSILISDEDLNLKRIILLNPID